jgi:hypothetical protein
MGYTFVVSKCDKLYDVLVQGGSDKVEGGACDPHRRFDS